MKVLLMAMMLTACGGKDTEPDEEPEPDTDETTACLSDQDCADYEICVDSVCIDGDRNNSEEEGEIVSNGLTYENKYINPAGDVDYYRLDSDGDEFVRIATVTPKDPDDNRYNTVVSVFDPNGELVAFVDGYPTGATFTSSDSIMYAYLATPGTYIIVVEDDGNYDSDDDTVAYGESGYVYSMSLSPWSGRTAEGDSPDEPGHVFELDSGSVGNYWPLGVVIDEKGDVDYSTIEFPFDNAPFIILSQVENYSNVDTQPHVTITAPEVLGLCYDNGVATTQSCSSVSDCSGSVYAKGSTETDTDTDTGTGTGNWVCVGYEAGQVLVDNTMDTPSMLVAPVLNELDYGLAISDASGNGGANQWFMLFAYYLDEDTAYPVMDFEQDPGNDDYANATTLDAEVVDNTSGSYSSSKVLGYADLPESPATADQDWYAIEAFTDGFMTVCMNASVLGSDITPSIAVYADDGTTVLDTEAGDPGQQDGSDEYPTAAIENIPVEEGSMYYIQVTSPEDANYTLFEWYEFVAYVADFSIGSYSCPP